MPECFHYLRHVVEACGETRAYLYDERLGRHVTFAEKANDEQLLLLAQAHEDLLKREDVIPLWQWLDQAENGRPSEKEAAWYLRGILMVLEYLAERGIEPFASHKISASPPDANQRP